MEDDFTANEFAQFVNMVIALMKLWPQWSQEKCGKVIRAGAQALRTCDLSTSIG
jgi:hypothetical protein